MLLCYSGLLQDLQHPQHFTPKQVLREHEGILPLVRSQEYLLPEFLCQHLVQTIAGSPLHLSCALARCEPLQPGRSVV